MVTSDRQEPGATYSVVAPIFVAPAAACGVIYSAEWIVTGLRSNHFHIPQMGDVLALAVLYIMCLFVMLFVGMPVTLALRLLKFRHSTYFVFAGCAVAALVFRSIVGHRSSTVSLILYIPPLLGGGAAGWITSLLTLRGGKPTSSSTRIPPGAL